MATQPSLDQPPVVFLLEDDVDYQGILCAVISRTGYRVVASGSKTQFLDSYRPDSHGCLVLDLHTPGCHAIDLRNEIARRGSYHPMIVISGDGTVTGVAQAMRDGAIDFLPKPIDHENLVRRVDEAIVVDAHRRLLVAERKHISSKLDRLSKRELDVLSMVADGVPSKQIAKSLEISKSTVDVHRSNIMKKMGATSSIEISRVISTYSRVKEATSFVTLEGKHHLPQREKRTYPCRSSTTGSNAPPDHVDVGIRRHEIGESADERRPYNQHSVD